MCALHPDRLGPERLPLGGSAETPLRFAASYKHGGGFPVYNSFTDFATKRTKPSPVDRHSRAGSAAPLRDA
jgi:hypothetical protein